MINTARQIELIKSWCGNTPWSEGLQLHKGNKYTVYYAPFDHINVNARIVLVGITPGITQAREALSTAQSCLVGGGSGPVAMQLAKSAASFGGRMRQNLVDMLDFIGLHEKLQLKSSAELFKPDNEIAHFTSVLRYPVLSNDGKMLADAREALKSELLPWFRDGFCQEINLLPDARYIPLGRGVEEVLLHLVKERKLSKTQILSGLPHPSGANAERIAYFIGKKDRDKLSVKTNPEKIESARFELTRRIQEI